MKVFMSWSGQRSKLTAELLHDWIKCVIQASQPWISSKGIERGAVWFSEINNELKDTTMGIICLTQENKNAPWILFEAGALAKGLSTNRVCTFLIDVQPADLQPPLSQFNHTFFDEDSMWSLVKTLNNGLEAARLDLSVLRRVFETYWPQFKTDFDAILKDNPPETLVPPRDNKDILAEILDATRSMSTRVRNLEAQSQLKKPKLFNSLYYANIVNSAAGISPLEMPDEDFTNFVNLAAMYLETGLCAQEVEERLEIETGLGTKTTKGIVAVAKLVGPSRGIKE